MHCSADWAIMFSRSTLIPDSSSTLFIFLFRAIRLSGSDEEPGLLKLINPVKREGKPDLADIELWPRCVPEGMVFKVITVLIVMTAIILTIDCVHSVDSDGIVAFIALLMTDLVLDIVMTKNMTIRVRMRVRVRVI